MEEITILQLAETYGKKADTLWRKAKGEWPDRTWSIHSPVTEDEGRVLLGDFPSRKSAGRKKAKPSTVKPSAPPKPAPAPDAGGQDIEAAETLGHAVVRVSADILAVAIVIGHAGLLWYDCAILWMVPGQIGGGIVFAVICLAVLLATQSNLPRSSRAALTFVALVDVGAWFVHVEVFKTPLVADIITECLCFFICFTSFAALYLYRDSKID